ncbi:hypothetical protein L7F22_038557 [Adiantum nelumboides]|nr:hypothetical protein [Adiantum nelumboides]
MDTVHTVIVMATAKGWFMHQMDVKNACLQGELQEEAYVKQPPGYEDDDLITVGDSEMEIEHVKGDSYNRGHMGVSETICIGYVI